MEIDKMKAKGFLAGILFAYFANRFWTFATNHISGVLTDGFRPCTQPRLEPRF
jgi:hypothetical protein